MANYILKRFFSFPCNISVNIKNFARFLRNKDLQNEVMLKEVNTL